MTIVMVYRPRDPGHGLPSSSTVYRDVRINYHYTCELTTLNEVHAGLGHSFPSVDTNLSSLFRTFAIDLAMPSPTEKS